MKNNRAVWAILAATVGLAGCASNQDVSQKEQERRAREMEKADRQQVQRQEKMLREATGQKKSMR